MKKVLITFFIALVLLTGIYYYLGGFNKWEFVTIENPPGVQLLGEEYQGVFNSDELKNIYFKYRNSEGNDKYNPIIVINYILDFDNNTGIVHSFIGIDSENRNAILGSEYRELKPSMLIRVELNAHNVVIPSAERVLERARVYAKENNLELGDYTIEHYGSEWLTIIEFPVEVNNQ